MALSEQEFINYKIGQANRNHKLWKTFLDNNFETDAIPLQGMALYAIYEFFAFLLNVPELFILNVYICYYMGVSIDEFFNFMDNNSRRMETEKPKVLLSGTFEGKTIHILSPHRSEEELNKLMNKEKRFQKSKKEIFKRLLQRMNEPLKISNKKPRKLRSKKLFPKLNSPKVDKSPKDLYDIENLNKKVNVEGLRKMKRTYSKINKKKYNIDIEFDKILKSIELERPMLLKDHIQSIQRDKSDVLDGTLRTTEDIQVNICSFSVPVFSLLISVN